MEINKDIEIQNLYALLSSRSEYASKYKNMSALLIQRIEQIKLLSMEENVIALCEDILSWVEMKEWS
jgi:hypothetical protein